MPKKSLYILEGEATRHLRKLSGEEYSRFKASADLFRFVDRLVKLVHIVEANRREFIGLIKEFRNAGPIYRAATIGPQRLDFSLNRAFINYLASLRMFSDHLETGVKRRHGQESSQYVQIKSALSHAYDSCFAYRFFYKLRNYSQHCGFPINYINSTGIDESSGEPVNVLEVGFDLEVLLSAFDGWGTKIRTELCTLPRIMFVEPLITEVSSCIEEVGNAFLETERVELNDSAAAIMTLAGKRVLDGETVVVGSIIPRKNGRQDLAAEYLPIELIKAWNLGPFIRVTVRSSGQELWTPVPAELANRIQLAMLVEHDSKG